MVMILSLMVVGIIMVGFRHFQQYRAMQQKNSDAVSDVLRIHNALNTWFFLSKEIKVEEETILFTDSLLFAKCMIGGQTVVLERGSMRDTIPVSIANLNIEMLPNTALVKDLYFEVGDTSVHHPFHYYKAYGKATIIKEEEIEDEH